MTRVSLKEAYDNKDVVAQIYAIRDIAEGAEDTANNAVSTANTASEHVDALVPQVEGAVQNANNASASAQTSATTVATYDTRLTAVENADTQNVKIDGDQSITGRKDFNGWDNITLPNVTYLKGVQPDNWKHFIGIDGTGNYGLIQARRDALDLQHSNIIRSSAVGSDSRSVITKAYVESTDEVTNNLVHRTANETISSIKTFTDGIIAYPSGWHQILNNQSAGEYVHFATYNGSNGWNALLEFMSSSNNGCEYGLLGISNGGDTEPTTNDAAWFVRGCGAAPNKILFQKNLYICHNAGSNEWHLVMYKHDTYGSASYRVKMENGYGANGSPESKIIAVTPVAVNFDSYTHKYRVSDAVVGSE